MPGQNPVRVGQPDLGGNGSGGARMIAGDHLDPDARRPAFGDGGNRLGAGRVDQADKAEEGKPALQRGCGSIRSSAFGRSASASTRSPRRASASARSCQWCRSMPPHMRSTRSGAPFTWISTALRPVGQHRHETVAAVEGDGVQPRAP